MQVKLKLFASLGRYLPDDAVRNIATIQVDEGTSVQQVLDAFSLPPESCHLVLVNGVFHAPEDRPNVILKEDDQLAVWPPVAGG